MAKYLKKKKNKRTPLVITIIALFLVLVLIALLAWGLHNTQESPSEQTDESGITDAAAESSGQDTIPAQINGVTLQEYALGKGLTLVEVGKYTGVYMEDGTDEIVSNVLMVIVRNDGQQDIQYAEITVPTLDGKVKFQIHEGTQPGDEFKLRGKGIQRLNYAGKGDQYVKINVEVPKGLSKAQKEKLREFDEVTDDKNYNKRKSFMDKVKDFFD